MWGIFAFRTAEAQYTIIPSPPPPQFTFNDLWQLTVNRTSPDAYTRFYISLRLFSGNGLLKVKSNSATVTLETGSRYYSLSNIYELQPLTTSFSDAGILQQAVSSGGMFPPGTYHIVYTLYGKSPDGDFTPLAEDAVEAVVEALWPPMLLSPANGEILTQPYPLLTWTPAFSSSYAGQIDYSLKLVQLLPGQNEFQAIQSNPAYFSAQGLPTTTLPYPAAAQLLDTGRVYAWQVHAHAGSGELGASEIWTFSLTSPQNRPGPKGPRYYIKPAQKVSPEFVRLAKAELPVALEESYFPTVDRFRFTVRNEAMETVATDKDFDSVIKTGLNTYVVSLCSDGSRITLKKGRYILEIRTEKNGKFYIPFELEKGGTCNE